MSYIIIITGASRGLGKAICLSFAKALIDKPIHFILTGRATTDLETTKTEILNIRSPAITTICDLVTADLSNINDLKSISESLFSSPFNNNKNSNHSDNDKLIFINNAGSLGPLVNF